MLHAASLLAALALQATEPASTVDPLTVTAPTSPALREFVDDVLEPARGGRFTGQIGRWNEPICPIAIGSSRGVHAAVTSRIRAVAAEVGAPVARGRCAPNIAVVVTDQPDRFVELFSEKFRFRFFGDVDRAELAAYITSDRPIRWWHASNEKGARTGGVMLSENLTSAPRIRMLDSRLEKSVQTSFARALIVVDKDQVKGLGTTAVADYVALVALAQIDAREAGHAMPTILNLFRPEADPKLRPKSLSRLDMSLLDGLYASKANVTFNQQRVEITQRAGRNLGRAEP